jgi:hypothetical protein
MELDRCADLRMVLGVLWVRHRALVLRGIGHRVLILCELTERLWRCWVVCWRILAALCSLLRARIADRGVDEETNESDASLC